MPARVGTNFDVGTGETAVAQKFRCNEPTNDELAE